MRRLLFAVSVLVAPACIQVIDVGWNDRPTGSTTSSTSGTGGVTGSGGTGGAPLCEPGMTTACYSGPPGTQGQGICQAGTKTCAPDGASWEPCVGEMLPQKEDCATPLDEDCDGNAPQCTGELLWAKRFGDAGQQQGMSIVADGSGNVLVTGYCSGLVADFGGGPLSGGPIFLLKLDADGNHLWSKRFGAGGSGYGLSVATDGTGNVLFTGYFGGTIDFGGGPLTSTATKNMFLVKLDPTGAHVWSKRFGNASTAGQAVAVDDAGNAFVTGYFDGSIDFGGGSLQSTSSKDAFVAKLDPGGAHLWSKSYGQAIGQSVGTDGIGNVLITGELLGTADFGGGPLTTAGGADIFLVKVDPSGSHLWSKRFGDGSMQGAQGIAIDAAGNAVVTGYFHGAVDFGTGPLETAGQDIFLAKFDASGTHLWSKRLGNAGSNTGRAVAIDGGGNIAITGDFGGQVDFGGGPLQSAGGSDVFMAKLDADSSHQWSKRFGDPSNQAGYAIAVDGAANVLVTGHIGGATDFGGGALMSAGMGDIFVAKFRP